MCNTFSHLPWRNGTFWSVTVAHVLLRKSQSTSIVVKSIEFDCNSFKTSCTLRACVSVVQNTDICQRFVTADVMAAPWRLGHNLCSATFQHKTMRKITPSTMSPHTSRLDPLKCQTSSVDAPFPLKSIDTSHSHPISEGITPSFLVAVPTASNFKNVQKQDSWKE